MKYLLSIIIGYLLGTLNGGYLLGKFNHIDIRDKGTGNAGASNTVITLGWAAGVGVAIFDILKATTAVVLARNFIADDTLCPTLAGCFAVLGHIFPFYMQFKGGKGFASFVGMIIGLNWKLALCLMALGVVVTLVTDFIAIATIAVCVITPVYLYFTGYDPLAVAMIAVVSLVMIYKHKINIQRMIAHEEIGLRRVNKVREKQK